MRERREIKREGKDIMREGREIKREGTDIMREGRDIQRKGERGRESFTQSEEEIYRDKEGDK